MNTEIEIKFLKIDIPSIVRNLQLLGAECQQERTLMKRVVFHWKTDDSYLRIRDEWSKITCTYKQIEEGVLNINSVKELECEIADFDTMRNIFVRVWLKLKSYQETYRQVWTINNEIFFMIDEWPWLNPFIEVEGHSEQIVRDYVKNLGFDYSKWVFGAVDNVYFLELWIPPEKINVIPEITFDRIPAL